MQWGGIKNGALLTSIERERCNVFLTGDKNMQNRQRLEDGPRGGGLPWPPPPECVGSGRMVIKMERVPSQRVKDPPNLVRACPFDLDRLLSHIDPGPAEESEAYVRLIYEQRRSDLSSKRNGKTGR
jgi:hypothetical protein